MAKTLQDYLGASATLDTDILTVNIIELYGLIFPDKIEPYPLKRTHDEAIAILLGALHKTAKPLVDADGLEVIEPEDAIVSTTSFQPKTFETRGESQQVKHELIFNVYTEDTTGFDPRFAV